MGILICKPLTALELGFLTCYLRTAQESAWSRWDEDRQTVAPLLADIARCLLGVRSGFDPVQWSVFAQLRTATERGHRRAIRFRDVVLANLADELGDPEEAVRQLPDRVRERAAACREEQARDWTALATFTFRCVEADPEAAAWWELGFGIASLTFRPDTAKAGIARLDDAGEGLRWEVEKLPGADRSWVKDVLPSRVEPTPGGGCRLLQAYHAMRDSLPGVNRQRGGESVERLFRPNQDFSRCWWVVTGDLAFDETERVVVRRLYEDMGRGGHGVDLGELLAGTRRSTQARLDAVFLHGSRDRRRYNPAWSEGLIENVYGGRYRLNLQGHKRTRKYTSTPASSD